MASLYHPTQDQLENYLGQTGTRALELTNQSTGRGYLDVALQRQKEKEERMAQASEIAEASRRERY
jgi:hypothetical protein